MVVLLLSILREPESRNYNVASNLNDLLRLGGVFTSMLQQMYLHSFSVTIGWYERTA
jgi:hypothetical protein